MRFLKIAALVLGACALVAANKVPSGADGYRDSFLDDGKQNYPVKLYGIAIDWDKACRQGKAAQCVTLADALDAGLGDLQVDPRGANGYRLLACDKGIAAACARAAQFMETGMEYYPPQLPRALQTAEKGCNLGDTTSCATAAIHYYRGDVTTADRTKAIGLWDNGCSKGDEEACRLKAGALYYDSGDDASQRQAVQLYSAGCSRKQGWGCSGYANALATGVGAMQSDAQAFEAGRKGCLESSGQTILACAIYARYLARSSDPAEVGKASQLLTKACLAKIGQACDEAGRVGQKGTPGSKIANWEIALSFRDGCDLGYGLACGDLGMLYANGSNEIKVNIARGIALLDKGCALKDEYSCYVLSNSKALADEYRPQIPAIDPAAPVEVQLAKAKEFVEAGRGDEAFDTVARLVEEANAEAQWVLGGWLYYGYPGAVSTSDIDTNTGFILIKNAADQGHFEAMKWVGMAYWEGDGVDVDQKKAMDYMAYPAERGDEEAIAIYRSMAAEPIRQENARRAAEMAAAAEARKNDFWSNFSAAASSWASSASSYSSSSSSSSSSWQSVQSIFDNSNFNQFVNSVQYGSVCPSYNKYC